METNILKSAIRHSRFNHKCDRVSACLHTGAVIIEKRKFPEVTKTDEDFDSEEIDNGEDPDDLERFVESQNDTTKQMFKDFCEALDFPTFTELLMNKSVPSSVVRVIASSTVPALGRKLKTIFPDDPNIVVREDIVTFIEDLRKYGTTSVKKERLFCVGHQGSGKTSLIHSLRKVFNVIEIVEINIILTFIERRNHFSQNSTQN